MNCSTGLRYADANQTNNIKLIGDKYVHMVEFMLVKYIQDMHIRLMKPISCFLPLSSSFGNRIGRQNATQIRESWLWDRPADVI